MTDERFLEELLEAVTVSGFEEEGQAVVRKLSLIHIYTVYGDGSVTCRLEGKQIQRGKAEPGFLPRIGIQMKAAKELQNAAWYGLGFQENYADSREAAWMGVYRSDVDLSLIHI